MEEEVGTGGLGEDQVGRLRSSCICVKSRSCWVVVFILRVPKSAEDSCVPCTGERHGDGWSREQMLWPQASMKHLQGNRIKKKNGRTSMHHGAICLSVALHYGIVRYELD